MQKYYTPKMVRLLNAARQPLIQEGRGWRATRRPSIRNRFNTGQVTVDVSRQFSGAAVEKLLKGPAPELKLVSRGPSMRLQLTGVGRLALKGLPHMCFKCGCTEDRACDFGCCWVTKAQDVCSACAVAP